VKLFCFLGHGLWRLFAREVLLRIAVACFNAVGRAFYPKSAVEEPLRGRDQVP